MFGCSVFGEAYFGDACVGGGAPPTPPLRVGGVSQAPWRQPRTKPREEDVDEFALLLALGFVE